MSNIDRNRSDFGGTFSINVSAAGQSELPDTSSDEVAELSGRLANTSRVAGAASRLTEAAESPAVTLDSRRAGFPGDPSEETKATVGALQTGSSLSVGDAPSASSSASATIDADGDIALVGKLAAAVTPTLVNSPFTGKPDPLIQFHRWVDGQLPSRSLFEGTKDLLSRSQSEVDLRGTFVQSEVKFLAQQLVHLRTNEEAVAALLAGKGREALQGVDDVTAERVTRSYLAGLQRLIRSQTWAAEDAFRKLEPFVKDFGSAERSREDEIAGYEEELRSSQLRTVPNYEEIKERRDELLTRFASVGSSEKVDGFTFGLKFNELLRCTNDLEQSDNPDSEFVLPRGRTTAEAFMRAALRPGSGRAFDFEPYYAAIPRETVLRYGATRLMDDISRLLDSSS